MTFYKAQHKLLLEQFKDAGLAEFTAGEEEDSDKRHRLGNGASAVAASARGGVASLRVLTVDQAQGSEADVVFLSCVRNPARSIGFVASANRLNVAVSRARERLVVVGDAHTLASNAHWLALRQACLVVTSSLHLPAMPRLTTPRRGWDTTTNNVQGTDTAVVSIPSALHNNVSRCVTNPRLRPPRGAGRSTAAVHPGPPA